MSKTALKLTALLGVGQLSCAVWAAPVRDDSQATKLVLQSIVKNNLTRLKTECLMFVPKDHGVQFEIDVRENHNQHCGGDPDTAPRLMTYLVDKKTGALQSNAFELAERHHATWSGQYYPVD